MSYECRTNAVRAQEEDDESDDEEDEAEPLAGIHFKASQQVGKWQKNWMRRVKALRAAERRTLYGFFSSMQRSAGEISQGFLVKHETFRRAAPHAPLSRTIVPHHHPEPSSRTIILSRHPAPPRTVPHRPAPSRAVPRRPAPPHSA